MSLVFNYSILQVIPDKRREERVNVGLVIFLSDRIDVEMLPSFSKVRALTDGINASDLQNIPDLLSDWIDFSLPHAAQAHSISGLGYLECSAIGTFALSLPSEYENTKRKIFEEQVAPIRSAQKKKSEASLFSTVRSQFVQRHLLGQNDTDINRHLLVPHFTVDSKAGLRADFALKNGCFHFIETIDLAGADAAGKFKEASLKAVTLDRARRSFGTDAKGYVVYRASANENFENHIELLANYSDKMVDFDNLAKTASFFDDLYQKAGYQLDNWPTN